MRIPAIVPLLLFLILLALLPFVFGQLFVSAMAKLKLRPTTDLLHLKDVANIATGIASIGGAGTFDEIVLSGIAAAYLALARVEQPLLGSPISPQAHRSRLRHCSPNLRSTLPSLVGILHLTGR